jgi:polyketide cyclase/dehydrase/lipid transport protein
MPKFSFEATGDVPPERFIRALTDFSPARVEVWPNVDAGYLKVHESGDDWADVTEGSGFAGGVWERNRYDWSQPGTVRIDVTDSNTWAPGSSWLYEVSPAGQGSRVRVTVDRRPLTVKGRLIGWLLVVAGRPRFRSDLRKVMTRIH